MGGLRELKAVFVVVVVAAFSISCLHAQTFGEVTGRVTDASGAVIPGAALTLTNVNTNAVRNTVTAEAGAYTFPSVPPGLYRLRTELPGFKTAASEQFEVQVQQVLRLDVYKWVRLAKPSRWQPPRNCCNPRPRRWVR
jgi:hypothetical protein